jgi:hypothetical protein
MESLTQTYESGKQSLVSMKDMAYQKYTEAWDATAKYVGPYGHAAYDSIHSAWELAGQAYDEAVHKMWEYTQSSIDVAAKEYDLAKANLSAATTNLHTWLQENGHALKENASQAQVDTLANLHAAETQAHQKYLAAKAHLSKIYDSTYDEAVNDYQVAKDRLDLAQKKLSQFTTDATEKASQDYEATKKKLADTQEKATLQYDAAKMKLKQFGSTLTSWRESAQKTAEETAQHSKQRAADTLSYVDSLKSRAQDKAAVVSDALLLKFQELSDASAKFAEEANKYWLEATASLEEYVARTRQWWSQHDVPSSSSSTAAPVEDNSKL